MKSIDLGGCGIQGRTTLYDLSKNESVTQITCADIPPQLINFFDFIDKTKIQTVQMDVEVQNALVSIIKDSGNISPRSSASGSK